MNLRLLATPLFAATLLLSTLGCSKKDEPKPDATPTAGYTIDGRAVKCNATGVRTTSYGFDALIVTLTTTPQPANGPEMLTLTFTKLPGEPIDKYRSELTTLTVTTASGVKTTPHTGTLFKLRTESSGKIAGDFTAYLDTPIGVPLIPITDGYFTGI